MEGFIFWVWCDFGNSWKYSSTAMHQRKAQWVPQKIFKVKVFDNVGLEERL